MSNICENLQLLGAVCKIGVYTVFCRLCCKGPPPPRPSFSVVCLGLTESGKTSLLTGLCNEQLSDKIEPTTGFLIKAVQLPKCILNIKEIGGGEKVRPFWKYYYKGAEAVIFVVDSASPQDEMEEARDALDEALKNPALKNLPCLILANCQDKVDARNEQQIREDLEVSRICAGRPWALHLSSVNDIKPVRDGFAKLTVFLLAPEEEQREQNKPTSSDNRI